MSQITHNGKPITTYGHLPEKGERAPHFELLKSDLSVATLQDFKGKRVIMNIFPSIDTNVCATSVRNFSEKAAELENVVVLNISRDLPFAQERFKNENEVGNVTNLSDFQGAQFWKGLRA